MTKLTLPKDISKEFILHLITKMFFLFAPSKIQGRKEKVRDFPTGREAVWALEILPVVVLYSRISEYEALYTFLKIAWDLSKLQDCSGFDCVFPAL